MEHIAFDAENHRVTYDGEPVDVLVYTGAVDELFGYRYVRLPYRSLDITYEYSDADSILPSEVVSYPQAIGYTRKTEYRKLMKDDSGIHGSVVATEYRFGMTQTQNVGTPHTTQSSRMRATKSTGSTWQTLQNTGISTCVAVWRNSNITTRTSALNMHLRNLRRSGDVCWKVAKNVANIEESG